MSQTRRQFLRQGVAAIAGLATASITTTVSGNEATRPEHQRRKRNKHPKANRVLMIALDGISLEGFHKAHTPNIDALLADGILSTETRVVMPSVTQPNWMSHLSGSGPEIHGVDRNDWLLDRFVLPAVTTDDDGYYPTLFKVLKDEVPGMKTAFYYNWKELINPYNTRYLDEVSFEENYGYVGNYAKARAFLKENADSPTVAFLYTVHTDHAGHEHAWMSPEYIASIEEADVNIGKLIQQLKDDGLYDSSHIMFLTDHGGIDHGHGGMTVNEMIVPWGIKGPGIAKGKKMTEPNNTVNTASVILNLFGVRQPLYWTGEVPYSIFAD